MLSKNVYKNYRELCKEMGWSTIGGNAKKKHMKFLSSICKYHKDGNKIIIDEIYKEPICYNIINTRNKGKLKKYNQLKVDEKYYDSKGIYIITNERDVYIGSTVQGFRKRFQQHYNGVDEEMKHTYDLLHNGGSFYILHNMDNLKDIELIRMVEEATIYMYTWNKKYNVINKLKSIAYKGKENKIQKYKKIKVKEEDYINIVQLLINKGYDLK